MFIRSSRKVLLRRTLQPEDEMSQVRAELVNCACSGQMMEFCDRQTGRSFSFWGCAREEAGTPEKTPVGQATTANRHNGSGNGDNNRP
ncbi:hypothetical protein PoB_001928000 [Plakobranchus ocellatus]|uniref:Uncharacterized protein n=1 Tax=Plakobranchus ocellatus TaxID=259542 RepID=A0AAV3ZC99_9GAST|nr:hypothetical protein PoB_001928000 [Plakobranchus ocellatus]